MIRLGVIGCGGRGQGILGLIERLGQDVKVVAVTDPRQDTLAAELVGRPWLAQDARYFLDADQMLDRGGLDGVVVATRCSLHATMGAKVLRRGLPLYLEKPVATTLEDWRMLADARAAGAGPVVVSFPLRVSPVVRTAKRLIDSGLIGSVEHVLAWCYPSYGGNYYHEWYRDERETGGLFLQKATHDFDYLNVLIGQPARSICAMASKRVFRGNRPAGLQCDQCGEQETCPESGFNLYYRRGERDRVEPTGRYCGFAVDTGNEDSSSAIIEYQSGMHAVYTQCFYPRKGAGARGARLTGYLGTLEFDWSTGEVVVWLHHEPRVERYEHEAVGGHGGGDTVLAYNFIQVIRGAAPSVAPLEAGLQSALMCLKARESAVDHAFKDVAP
jgi:predicted dehydrogenase